MMPQSRRYSTVLEIMEQTREEAIEKAVQVGSLSWLEKLTHKLGETTLLDQAVKEGQTFAYRACKPTATGGTPLGLDAPRC